MTVTELLLALHDLNRADKLRVLQFLVAEFAKEEEMFLTAGTTYPVWSPHAAFEAADTLLAALASDKADHT